VTTAVLQINSCKLWYAQC